MSLYTCARCLRASARHELHAQRHFSSSAGVALSSSHVRLGESNLAETTNTNVEEKEQGAMSRRLSDMSERNLEEGGRSAQKAVEEAGFDADLKEKLLDRIADSSFRSQNASAFAQAGLPSSAGKGTRDIAAAKPWSGTESLEDAALRMLNDAHRPMRGPARIPTPRGAPIKIETGKTKRVPTGARLANARDKSSMYSYLKDDSLSEKEREQMRRDLKERFTPAARAVPATLRGLASLANERIEDAIARGQFKNLPRGKQIERDYNMSSPFLDTTEYFMNKIIQKQDIVPPWIEKQQELTSTATKFRSRLRVEWKRHAARLISSQGGSLASQIKKAEQYAAAEAIVNPTAKKVEQINTVDSGGHVSQITLSGQLKAAPAASDNNTAPVIEIITVTESSIPTNSSEASLPITNALNVTSQESVATPSQEDDTSQQNPASNPHPTTPLIPFRDPVWERTENSYHTLAITNLNSITRSYNLMAPNLAKKPYYSLDRELRSCYADVAPLLAAEIRERALRPVVKVEVVGHREGGVLERFGAGEKARVWDEKKPKYGFKEFWRDLRGG